MAKLLTKINQNGADTLKIDETQDEVFELMKTNIIFQVHVAGEKRTFNRDYVYCVIDDTQVDTNDQGQLL